MVKTNKIKQIEKMSSNLNSSPLGRSGGAFLLGIGTDIVEIARIAKSIEKKGFKEKVFSKIEIDYCETKKNKAESFAARFAAKEAFFKALGTGWRDGMAFNEVETRNDALGKPSLHILGKTAKIISKKNIKTIHLSLSHAKETAIAMVVLEGAHPNPPKGRGN